MKNNTLNDPHRYHSIKSVIHKKPALLKLYRKVYSRYLDVITRSSGNGAIIEIGSGAGFVKEIIPDIVTTDILPYEGVDQVVDARDICYSDGSLRAICMWNVFHHIPDVGRFLSEAERCLCRGGRLLIADQHNGILSRIIFRYFHHEPFEPGLKDWEFESSGPLSGANGALAWMVFNRDLKRFQSQYPNLKMVYYETHSPLIYWISGGLKAWSLLPRFMTNFFFALDKYLLSVHKDLGSFVFIEIEKI